MSHMKANCKVGIATKQRKKHKAFMPDPNESDEHTLNLSQADPLEFSTPLKQPETKLKIVPMHTDTVPKEQYK